MMPADLSAFINICARLNTSILYSDGMREVVEELWGDRLELAHSCRRRGREAELYRVPEIVTRGRFPDGGESDSRWRTQEARHVGSDTIAPGF